MNYAEFESKLEGLVSSVNEFLADKNVKEWVKLLENNHMGDELDTLKEEYDDNYSYLDCVFSALYSLHSNYQDNYTHVVENDIFPRLNPTLDRELDANLGIPNAEYINKLSAFKEEIKNHTGKELRDLSIKAAQQAILRKYSSIPSVSDLLPELPNEDLGCIEKQMMEDD